MLDIIEHVKTQLKIQDSAFVGLFLYGSQNYGLNTDSSDCDYICVLADYEMSYNTLMYQNGVVKVYNLRWFLNKLKQGDLECLECLYSDHQEINSNYSKTLKTLVNILNKSINIDCIKASLSNKLAEHLTVLRESDTKYSKKRLYWAVRVADQLTRVAAGESFKDSLKYKSDNLDELLKIKTIDDYITTESFLTMRSELEKILVANSFESSSYILDSTNKLFEAEARIRGLKYTIDSARS
jgi:hypothetical protein